MSELVVIDSNEEKEDNKIVEELPLENLHSSKETLLREWDFVEKEKDENGNKHATINNRIVLTDERLIVAQEYKTKSAYKRRKFSYRLEDVKAINSYEENGKITRKNPISKVLFIIAGILFLVGISAIIAGYSASVEIPTSSNVKVDETSSGTSIVWSVVCLVGAVVSCIIGACMREKKEKTSFLAVEIESAITEKQQLLSASKLNEDMKYSQIKTAIVLPANKDTKLFVEDLDNAVIEAQMNKVQSANTKVSVSNKTNKRTKK